MGPQASSARRPSQLGAVVIKLELTLPAGVVVFVDPPILAERVGADGVGRYRLGLEVKLAIECEDTAAAKKLARELAPLFEGK